MSCAVAFQPCLQPITGRELPSSALQTNLTMASPSPLHSKARLMSNTYPSVSPYSPSAAEPRSSLSTKSGPRSPLSDDYQNKPFKKLCAMNRECYSSPSKLPYPEPNTPSPFLSSNSSEHPPESPSPGQASQSEIKYLSANCIVVTHYRGDAASVVDEHFTRALAIKTSRENESSLKVLTRSFPASFYQPQTPSRSSIGIAGSMAAYTPSEIYEAYHGGLHSIQSATGTDPWAYPFSAQAFSHRGAGTDVYPSAMSSSPHPYQYSSVGFQQHLSRIPAVPVPSQMNKTEMWGGRYYDSFAGATDISNGIEAPPYSSHYSNVTASLQGFEAPISQECPKDLYWL